MKYIGTSVVIGFLLTACTPSAPSNKTSYIYHGINFGTDRNFDFRKGVQDACRTANGQYTKNRELFNNNISYKTGWEDGRIQCKGK
jgi:hypothetical protein